VIDHVPLRRIGQPSDIAGAVYFLMSDLASYVNGSILHVEGGDLNGSRGFPHMPPSPGR
jgi:3-oxoacyl-[acyl-carrier protein] reductase